MSKPKLKLSLDLSCLKLPQNNQINYTHRDTFSTELMTEPSEPIETPSSVRNKNSNKINFDDFKEIKSARKSNVNISSGAKLRSKFGATVSEFKVDKPVDYNKSEMYLYNLT